MKKGEAEKKSEVEDGDELELPVPAVLTPDHVTSSPTDGDASDACNS